MIESPYKHLSSLEAWKVIKDALKKLENNQDIRISTKDEYVIGYLVKMLLENKLIKDK